MPLYPGIAGATGDNTSVCYGAHVNSASPIPHNRIAIPSSFVSTPAAVTQRESYPNLPLIQEVPARGKRKAVVNCLNTGAPNKIIDEVPKAQAKESSSEKLLESRRAAADGGRAVTGPGS